jgi:hypothetical protein
VIDEHQYLFILCSHSSGSTALWRLLQTSPHVSALPVEGQFVEAVGPLMRKTPWNPQEPMPWPAIKAEWEKVWDMSRPILLEKSPPHLIRAQAIEQAFPNAHFIVMVRNPYAYCEGTKRRGRTGLGYPRNATYAQIAGGWVREGQHQMDNLRLLQRTLCLTYEELAENPAAAAAKVLSFMPGLERLDVQAAHLIHSLEGWLERPITNLNSVQIARLSAEDIHEINAVLYNHSKIMAFFGYDYLADAYDSLNRVRLAFATLFTRHIRRNIQRVLRRTRRAGQNPPLEPK